MELTMPTQGKNFHKLTVKTNVYVYFSFGKPIAVITPVDKLIAEDDGKNKIVTRHFNYIRERHTYMDVVPAHKIIKVAKYFF